MCAGWGGVNGVRRTCRRIGIAVCRPDVLACGCVPYPVRRRGATGICGACHTEVGFDRAPDNIIACGGVHGELEARAKKIAEYGISDATVAVAMDCGFGLEPWAFTTDSVGKDGMRGIYGHYHASSTAVQDGTIFHLLDIMEMKGI